MSENYNKDQYYHECFKADPSIFVERWYECLTVVLIMTYVERAYKRALPRDRKYTRLDEVISHLLAYMETARKRAPPRDRKYARLDDLISHLMVMLQVP